jgi:2,5-diketo-D-gluconate reductase B
MSEAGIVDMGNVYFSKTYQRSFGTFPLKGPALANAVATAIQVGYRSIDTAQMYRNESDLGAVLADLPVPRSELCITTKVHPENYAEDKFLASVEKSLLDLKLDYVDVLALHWPPIDRDIVPSLRLLEKAQTSGFTRNVGVSNYTAAMMRIAKTAIGVPLVVNQVEFHPLLNQDLLLAAASQTGIPLSSYCSVARGEVFKYPIFGEIGAVYGKSAAQVVLRWILQKGVPINTMSTNPANIAANFNIVDFTLSSIDMERIEALKAVGYRIVDKSRVPWAPSWD